MDSKMDIDPPDHNSTRERLDNETTRAATTTTNRITTKRKTPPTPTPSSQARTPNRTRTLTTLTIKHPPWSYVHLTVATPGLSQEATWTTLTGAKTTTPISEATPTLDMLQVRAYLTAALRQFLGDTGAAIPIDILALREGGGDSNDGVWVRVPRQDLNLFVGAVTAFEGQPVRSAVSGRQDSSGKEGRMVLQVKAAGNWLGSLLGREDEGRLWAGPSTRDQVGG